MIVAIEGVDLESGETHGYEKVDHVDKITRGDQYAVEESPTGKILVIGAADFSEELIHIRVRFIEERDYVVSR